MVDLNGMVDLQKRGRKSGTRETKPDVTPRLETYASTQATRTAPKPRPVRLARDLDEVDTVMPLCTTLYAGLTRLLLGDAVQRYR